jgi:hypothetical protein
MSRRAFTPAFGSDTTYASNSATATTAIVLPVSCEEVVLTNTSLTARVHFMVTYYEKAATQPTGTAPTLTTGICVLPNSQIEIGVGPGFKLIRSIASAADGVYGVNPGNRA